MSIYQSGDFMSQRSQPRIGLASQPFCLLLCLLCYLIPMNIGDFTAVHRSWRSEWQKALLTRIIATLTYIIAQFRRETSLFGEKLVKFWVQLFRATL